MVINEIFYSLQGEGRLAGTPSIFVRLAGCPLRCRWCDTQYAWSPTAGIAYTPEQLRHETAQYPTRYIVFTGGEPTAAEGLASFLRAFVLKRMHITIETAGLVFIPDLPCDLMSISPKLSNSTPIDPRNAKIHDAQRLNHEAISRLMEAYEYQLKFVVDATADLDEIAQCLEQLKRVDPEKVLLMPQARTKEELIAKSQVLAQVCKQTGFAMSPRWQVLLWDGQRGT
ncbi:MAG: 7-carboxy-7-deazaguanine synthase QueE [Sedimentisphaerales bacterium]|nr:7-carboxy-7-deazaguanine synthase QueE [Sedimentisphaerales bacterium]